VEDDAPKTLSVPKAGKQYFNLGRNASYEAARRGDLPVIKIGRRLRVSIVALERMLTEAGTNQAEIDLLASPRAIGGGRDEHRLTYETTGGDGKGGKPCAPVTARSNWS
jgi:hypothetical protein